MVFNAKVVYKAFPHHGLPPVMEISQVVGSSWESACEELFRAFNHGVPGRTGELAEHFKVRSMSVGDEVHLTATDDNTTRRFVCASAGFTDIDLNPEALEDFMVKVSREPR